MSISKHTSVGILHPGAMGIFVGATIKNGDYPVYWVSEGRSPQTQQRSEEHGLLDAGTLAVLCQHCDVIVSICPPHAAEQVADSVIAQRFTGTYLDANAISPQKSVRIGEKLQAANITFVDGSVIGGPSWQADTTWLYLSGEAADKVSTLFHAGPLETEVIGTEIGKASALKMCFAANSKGTTALLSNILAAAEKLGVRDHLERQWTRYDDGFAEQTQQRTRRVTAKAWRFAGEMEEIAATFAEAGLPDGFHRAAHDVYERMAQFKDMPELPELLTVLAALLQQHHEAKSD